MLRLRALPADAGQRRQGSPRRYCRPEPTRNRSEVVLNGRECVSEVLLLVLMSVGDRHTAVLVAVVVDDHFLAVADDDDELASAEFEKTIKAVSDNGFLVNFDYSLRFVSCEWSESRSLSENENGNLQEFRMCDLFIAAFLLFSRTSKTPYPRIYYGWS
jgi:hypothetical protein